MFLRPLRQSLATFAVKSFCNLPLSQRDVLRRTAAHNVLNLHRRRRDSQHLVASIDNLAFARDEYILTLGEENFLRLAWLAREAEKLQRNRWRWCHRRRRPRLILRVVCGARSYGCRNRSVRLRNKNVSSRSLIRNVLGRSQLCKVQSGVETLRCSFFLACVARPVPRPSLGRSCGRRPSGGCRRWRRRRNRRGGWHELVHHAHQQQHCQCRRQDHLLPVVSAQFHYAPAFKYVTNFICNLIGPFCSLARPMPSMMKNVSSRSSALINF